MGRALQACMAATLSARACPRLRGSARPAGVQGVVPLLIQNGGHGIEGHSPRARGSRCRCSSRSARRTNAATSRSAEQLAQPVGRLVPGPAYGGQLGLVSSAPAQPQSRVRSLWSVWKLTPWSTPNTAAAAAQDVAALAVGVVDQHVEDRQPPQGRHVGVDHRDRPVVGVQPLHARGTSPRSGTSDEGTRSTSCAGRLLVGVDPGLERARAERPVGEHGHRHAVEPADPGHLVRGHLPVAEGAVREVPQRPLPLDRLVDALDRPVSGRRARPGRSRWTPGAAVR